MAAFLVKHVLRKGMANKKQIIYLAACGARQNQNVHNFEWIDLPKCLLYRDIGTTDRDGLKFATTLELVQTVLLNSLRNRVVRPTSPVS